jgi:hypothetical protein
MYPGCRVLEEMNNLNSSLLTSGLSQVIQVAETKHHRLGVGLVNNRHFYSS